MGGLRHLRIVRLHKGKTVKDGVAMNAERLQQQLLAGALCVCVS